jgi:hypothetical protein
MLFALARRLSNGVVALVAWVVWLAAPLGMRFRPTYLSELTTGAIWLVAWWTLLRYRETGARRWLVALAALVAWGGITRPLTMIVFAIPTGLMVLWTVWRRRAWWDVAAALPGALAICAIIPIWSHAVLGSWNATPYSYYSTLYFPIDNPGFGVNDTPGLRPLPDDMRRFVDFVRPLHVTHVPAQLPRVLGERLSELRGAIWGGNLVLQALAAIGLLAMTGPLALALTTCAGLLIAYLWFAHPAEWAVYYLEIIPVMAFLTAAGLSQVATVVAARLGRLATSARPTLALAGMGALFVMLMAWPVSRAHVDWRHRFALSRRYQDTFRALVAKIPDSKAIVFVRYAPDHFVHLSLIANGPEGPASRIWTVHDRGDDNQRLMRLAPDRTAYLYEELPGRVQMRWIAPATVAGSGRAGPPGPS